MGRTLRAVYSRIAPNPLLKMLPFLLRVGSKFVCWDAFAARWYLGSKSNVETFFMGKGDPRRPQCSYEALFLGHDNDRPTSPRTEEALALFPSADLVWVQGSWHGGYVRYTS